MRKDVYPHMNFEQYIADRLSKGASVEDLAKEMTDTLNKKQKELAEQKKKEEQAAKKQQKEKEKAEKKQKKRLII